MRYCLDTNTCIDALRGNHPTLAERFSAQAPDELSVSSVVRAELLLGALKSLHPKKSQRIVKEFLAPMLVVPFDSMAADHYAAIRHSLEKKGKVIGPNDLIIAAVARSRNLTLVTHNTREFRRVPNLNVEDWLAG